MKNNFLTTALSLVTFLASLIPSTAHALPQNPSYQTVPSAQATIAPAPTRQLPQQETCISFEPIMPDNLPLSGVWVFDGGAPTLEEITEHTKYAIPLRGGGILSSTANDLAISPDGLLLAYIDYSYTNTRPLRAKTRMLHIMRSTGHEMNMDFWSLDWQWILGWVDNQTIAVYTAKHEVILLNPLTGLWSKFQQPSWIEDLTDGASYHFWRWELPEYSTNLQWVINRPDYDEMTLKSVETGNIVWQTDQSHPEVGWSIDGSALAIADGASMMIIQDGKKRDTLDMAQLRYQQVSNPKFSNNLEKLIFKSTDASSSTQLHIFDLTHHKLAKLCTDMFQVSSWQASVWSPDGRFVIQSAQDAHYNSLDLLIDTEEMRVYPLDTPAYQNRVAWMANP